MNDAHEELRDAAANSPKLKPDAEAAAELEARLAAMHPADYEKLLDAVKTCSSASSNRRKLAGALVQLAKFGVLLAA